MIPLQAPATMPKALMGKGMGMGKGRVRKERRRRA